ncbi:hypothetical protein AAFF_G00287730 [Aldrovandia affinis]|uniref:Uncharacterized protein n=1 Tax=Aldrovandia affinis TaxID=143900 RepID=A0AAD7WS01_9TELE|nr:hypothetical protein AAFF_G00287730 [Aldrovandia affinis]
MHLALSGHQTVEASRGDPDGPAREGHPLSRPDISPGVTSPTMMKSAALPSDRQVRRGERRRGRGSRDPSPQRGRLNENGW